MSQINFNADLFNSISFFQNDENLRRASVLFGFKQRRIGLGIGAVSVLGKECERLGIGRVILICDKGVKYLEDRIKRPLIERRIEIVETYSNIVSNPTVDSVRDCGEAIVASGADGVVVFGGGSAMDTAKASASIATTKESIDNYWGFDKIPEPSHCPVIAIPTTAGTGSEASRVCVVADSNGKNAVYSDYLQPKVALVDPQLHVGMPPQLTAVTGLDAIGHALECTASKKSDDIGDAVARESLRQAAIHFIPAVLQKENELDARFGMARCALLAGLLLGPINTGAGHALGYGIEKLSFLRGKPIPHGAAVALVLPGVMRHNAMEVAQKYYFAAGVSGCDMKGKTLEEGCEAAANWLDNLRRCYTPYTSLKAVGIGQGDISEMVKMAMTVRRLLDPNPALVEEVDAEAIYSAVLD